MSMLMRKLQVGNSQRLQWIVVPQPIAWKN